MNTDKGMAGRRAGAMNDAQVANGIAATDPRLRLLMSTLICVWGNVQDAHGRGRSIAVRGWQWDVNGV